MGLRHRLPSPRTAALYLLVFVLTVTGVSAALVLAGPYADAQTTRYATVDLGPQPNDVAQEVSPGDVMRLGDRAGRLTVTDSFTTPAGGGESLVTVRIELTGDVRLLELLDRDSLCLDGTRVHPGDTVTIETLQYSLEGRVVSVGGGGPTIHDKWTTVAEPGAGTGSAPLLPL